MFLCCPMCRPKTQMNMGPGPGFAVPSGEKVCAELGLIRQDGERASMVLVIDDGHFCLTLEPAKTEMGVFS
jgi:hypothetical protein